MPCASRCRTSRARPPLRLPLRRIPKGQMTREGASGTSEQEEKELKSLLRDACPTLKVFPLPGIVVFPGTPAPLHIFEPRYRAMVADALEGDRMIAIPML